MDNFSFIRSNTDTSDVPSQLSMSMPIKSKITQTQRKTNQLINKTLKCMSKQGELMQFTKKIMIPKIKRNLFLQQQQRKKQQRLAHKLLSNGLKAFSKPQNHKKCFDQHNIYDDPNQNKKNKRYSSLKGHLRRDKTKNSAQKQKTKSLSKIQLLTTRQRQQAISDEKYDNENYIFLNLKKMGESRDISQHGSEEQLGYLQKNNKNDKQQNLNLNNSKQNQQNQQNLSISLNIESPIRPKVKSLDKHDREKFRPKQSVVKFGMNFHNGKTHSYRKQSQFPVEAEVNKGKSMETLFKLFPVKQTPKNEIKSDSIVSGLRSLLGMNGVKRSPSKNSQKGAHVMHENAFLQQLQQIKRFYEKSKQQTDCLHNLLTAISKQKNKDAIRIYKEDFGKIYIYRYGRDRITQFFDYEYIEDYSSLLELFTSTVLNFNQNEVILISFMLLDYDNDGLISHSDLFKLLTLMGNNQLARKTIFTIIKYVQQYVERQNTTIKDSCQDDYIKKQNFTWKKYKFLTYMNEKKNNEACSKQVSSFTKSHIVGYNNRQSTVVDLKNRFIKDKGSGRNLNKSTNLSASICKKHFTLKKQKDEGSNDFKILRAFLQSMAKSSQIFPNGTSYFWINLSRFKSIYESTVPQIYYDILYSAFGLQMKGINYDKIDCETPLIKQRKVSMVQQYDDIDILYENLQQMRFTKEDLKIKQLKPDIKRRRKIKSVLQ